MEDEIKINFCKCCKKNSKGCMNIENYNVGTVKIYKCTNYENNIKIPEYFKKIEHTFYDEAGNYIAILKSKVSHEDILELRKYFDYVKYKE